VQRSDDRSSRENGATPVRAVVRRVLAALLCLVVALGLASSGAAATLSATCLAQRCDIFLSGRIEHGDADRLAALLRQRQAGAAIWDSVHLDSPGGDVEEALRLGTLVRDALLYTQNAPDALHRAPPVPRHPASYTCASACFLVLVAGANRFMRVDDAGGRIGCHRPRFEAQADGAATAELQPQLGVLVGRMRAYLAAQGVSARLIDTLMQRPNDEMYWLSRDEVLHEIGLAPAWFDRIVAARCPVSRPAAGSTSDEARRGAALGLGHALMEQSDCLERLRAAAQARLKGGLAPPG